MKRLLPIVVAVCLLASFSAPAAAPVILSQPQGVTVNTASAAGFAVAATNAAAYQWQFDGASLAGATNATLSLDDVSSNQAGSYTVVVTSSNNISTNSTPAVLTIVPGTVIQWTISTYPDGSSNNFLVQLFDHDKPATVANFIHYITSGGYSNMFFDRDVTNFVLQGGDYFTEDRTTNGINERAISPGTNFPNQLDNEFGVGPLIHNRFGTLVMALQSGKTNSATSAFFFNLADNSTNLDSQDFTVFGRILYGTNTGSNVLQYFNTLSTGYGICTNFSQVPTLPVNYDGTNDPKDANFFYCDFAFQTTPPVITNPPTVSITFPAPSAAFTNSGDLTATGTASGNLGGLADVYCVLTTLAGLDEGARETNTAIGTSDWSLDLGTNGPGVYELTAYAQDGVGNNSAPATVYFTNLATLTIITNAAGTFSTNIEYLAPGQQYTVTAEPGAGETFVDWQIPGAVSLNPVQTFTVETNFTIEVAFASSNLPPGLAIASPAADSTNQTTNAGLTISGTLPSAVTIKQLTVQLFFQTNAVTAKLPAVIAGTNWSLALSNLAGGPYTVVVEAEDSLDQEGLATENFTALVPPVIVVPPQNVTANTGSSADFSVTANHAASYQWELAGGGPIAGTTNATLALDDVSSNLSGSAYAVVVTAPDGETVTSTPPAVLTVVQGTIIQWTISKYPDGSSNTFQVELFDHDKPATVQNFLHCIVSGAYSNMFFDRDVTNSVLQGGDYVSSDRTTNGLNISAISPGTNFPSQVDSEFGVGPLIHNTYGTLAMALASGETNEAASAFLFNLADNSASLDSQDFTVFGRILGGTNSGSNVLQYFNSLSAPSNGLYDDTTYGLPTLPVNYDGTNAPTNASLFYCDFAFPTPPLLETNVPAVSITYPAPDAVFTNATNLTVAGTASDPVGLAEVYCVLTTLAGAGEGESLTNAALGTTNWSLALSTNGPGVYQVTAYAQNGAGYLSPPATEYFTNLAELTILTNVNGHVTSNPPLYLLPGQTYSVAAAPGAGEVFEDWQVQGVVSIMPAQTFTVESNLTIEVTYISNNLPAGLAITSPAAGAVVPTTNAGLTVSGTLPSLTNITRVTVQLFSQSNAVTTAVSAVIAGTNWSLALSHLVGGPYTIVVMAEDSTGQEGMVTESFTASVPPIIVSQPQSATVNTGSSADFKVTASNTVSYQWQLEGTGPIEGATNATLALDNVSSNLSGSSYAVVVTAPDGETVTSAPPAVLTVVPGTIIQWTISKYPDGSSNSFLVELFDHDKPATVQNFIHYIASGAYSNTFFDTDQTNYVLQGGDLVTADRTTNYLTIENVPKGTNIFPSQVDSEFGVGPLIHNTYGTLAMALVAGKTNSATSGFFFNLEDNSTNLEGSRGGYTVFGRILGGTNSGSNVLQYFNTLSAPNNGIYTNFSQFTNLPVNYDGTNEPTDASVFYCDFKFISPTNPPVDTTPPTVSIASPAPNVVFTNASSLKVQGAALDNVGLAEVFCTLTSSTGAYNDRSQTNAALGTTNWSLNISVEPGVYLLQAFAQDGAGNLSAPATQYVTNLAILTVVTNAGGLLATNAPQYMVPGEQYSVTAPAVSGQQFYGWTSNGATSLNPVLTFTANGNITLTANYLPANVFTGLTIASPVSGGKALSIQSALAVSGSIASTNVTQLTCQIFANSNSVSAALPATIAGTNWSLTVTSNYANGSYMAVALAGNAAGQLSSASASFTLLNVEMLTLKTNGGGTIAASTNIVRTNSLPYLVPGSYTFKAAPDKGYVFYSWNNGAATTLNPTNTIHLVSNLTLTATFVPEDTSLTGLSFTYPPANAMLTNGAFSVEGTLPTSLTMTQLTCQLFLQSNGLTASPQAVTIVPTATKFTLPVTNLTAGSNLPAGPYKILAVGYDKKGNTRLVSETFNLLARLMVNVKGKGAVTAGLNGKYLEAYKSYNITATPAARQAFAFWTGPVANTNSAKTTFTLSSNTVLTANFGPNPFPSVAGAYTGLFLNPSNVSPTNAGFVKVTVGSTGVFTGDLMFPSVTYPIYYQFPYNGQVFLEASNAFDSNFLAFALSLDLTNGPDTITGYVADVTAAGTAIWVDDLVLYRAATKLSGSNEPAAGKYVLLAQPANASNGPAASGYAAVSLAAGGAITLSGALPDNTAISQSAKMSKDGIWPVYIVPSSYKGKGMVIGWQTNDLSSSTGACEGQLFWYKPGAGVVSNLTTTGGAFAAPLADTQYQMLLAGGAAYSLTVGKTRQFVAQSNIVAISLQSSGVLSGYIDLSGGKFPFKGAFISPSGGGAGFIIDTDGQKEGFQLILDENK
jgi:cyclophilin family peptidyl-prolyl cis-trans isomerase